MWGRGFSCFIYLIVKLFALRLVTQVNPILAKSNMIDAILFIGKTHL